MLTSSNPNVGSIFMHQEVKRPLGLTRAVPEINRVVQVTSKEISKGMYNHKRVGLPRVNLASVTTTSVEGSVEAL